MNHIVFQCKVWNSELIIAWHFIWKQSFRWTQRKGQCLTQMTWTYLDKKRSWQGQVSAMVFKELFLYAFRTLNSDMFAGIVSDPRSFTFSRSTLLPEFCNVAPETSGMEYELSFVFWPFHFPKISFPVGVVLWRWTSVCRRCVLSILGLEWLVSNLTSGHVFEGGSERNVFSEDWASTRHDNTQGHDAHHISSLNFVYMFCVF